MDYENKIFDEVGLSEEKLELIHKIHNFFDIGNVGLVSYFDKYNSDYYTFLPEINGFCHNIEFIGRGDIDSANFDDVFNNNYRFLIWIPEKIANANLISFTFNYSHELQHLIHSKNQPQIPFISDFIWFSWKKVGEINPLHWLMRPDEYNCEKNAFQALNVFFDYISVENFKISENFCNDYWIVFKVFEKIYLGDVEYEMKQILTNNYKDFKSIQGELSEERKHKFDIDEYIELLG